MRSLRDISRWGMLCCLFWLAACQFSAPDAPRPETKAPHASTAQSIIGGAPDNRYPAIGALTRNRGQFCTGTLITPQLVITAAHCLSPGSMQFRIHRADGTTTYHDVKQQVGHPGYSQAGGRIKDDVALLILTQPVTGVTTIPASTTVMDQSWIGRKIQYLGYGLISTNPRRSTQKKYGVQITLQQVQGDRFMTRDPGKSICFGDSGGPALYTVGGQLMVVGVNSYVPNQQCSGGSYCFRVDAYYKSFFEKYITQYGGKCTKDADCGPCRTCDVASGKCLPVNVPKQPKLCKACKTNADCGGGTCVQRPEGNRCLQACNASGCCPAGFSCNDVNGSKQCVPSSGRCPDVSCTSDAECGPGETCKNGKCSRPGKDLYETCSDSDPCLPGLTCVLSSIGRKICFRDCSGGGSCNPEGGKCYSSNEGKQLCLCNTDNPCNAGYQCKLTTQNGLCLRKERPNPDCKSNAECPSDQECKGGKCVPKGSPGPTCTSDADCPKSYKCSSGQCVLDNAPPPGCTKDADCPAGQKCQAGKCVTPPPPPGCTKDADCPAGQKCQAGKCVGGGNPPPGCSSDADCLIGFVCQAGTCAKGARPPCQKDTDCNVGFKCLAGNCTQKAPPQCTQDVHCPPGAKCINEKCVAQQQCTQDPHCPAGQICINYQCIPGGNPGEERERKPFDAGGTPPPPPPVPDNGNNNPPVQPPGQNPFPPFPPPRKQGCGCSTASDANAPGLPAPFFALLLLLPLTLRRKR